MIEPFAGGGIVSLTAVFENLTAHATMVEIDDQVAAVWQTILSMENSAWLAEQIVGFQMSAESVNSCLSHTSEDTRTTAFQTLLRNRVYHGGILANGSGLIKLGENGKGLHSRWYPDTLRKRIVSINAHKNKITFIHGDGMRVLTENAHRTDAVFFIDPPYTAAGKKAGARLYNHCTLDHQELFHIASMLRGDFLMTYDNSEAIVEMAHKHGFQTRLVAMTNTHHAVMNELLIGRNLDWVR
jgi:DNA adenine methylase